MSSIYMAVDEYVPYAPAHVGTVSKHHCKSGVGNDRLYITRCEDGYTILAYCHHCGKKGKHNQKDGMTIEQMKAFKPVEKSRSGKYTMPSATLLQCNSKTPVVAQQWVRKARVTLEEADAHGMRWSKEHDRVIIPVTTFGQLSMIQSRRIMDEDSGPKYCNYKNFDGLPFRSFHPSLSTHKFVLNSKASVVIVEDALSCIRVGRQLPCIALMGTHLSDIMLSYLIAKRFKNFLVFLDDDNPEVKWRQQDLHKRLSMFGKVAVVHTDGTDPKELDEDDLELVLANALEETHGD